MSRARLWPSSSSSTLRRKRARYVAAVRPAGPPPTIRQSRSEASTGPAASGEHGPLTNVDSFGSGRFAERLQAAGRGSRRACRFPSSPEGRAAGCFPPPARLGQSGRILARHHAGAHARARRARIEQIDPHLGRRRFRRIGPRQHIERRLGDGIGPAIGAGIAGRARGDEDRAARRRISAAAGPGSGSAASWR